MPFTFEKTKFDGLLVVQPRIFKDARGFFLESYKKSDFEAQGVLLDFVQDNYSRSTRGVLRGLHYQMTPHAQGKLIRCVHGEVYDVAVDIREQSATFGQHYAATLSAANQRMLYIPPGFAHGFVTLSEVADIEYKVTHEYAADADRGIRWDDPALGIEWPLKSEVILSPKDQDHPLLKDAEIFP